MQRCFPLALAFLALLFPLFAQTPPPGPEVAPFLSVTARDFALVHVRVIDGTGAPAQDDQTVVVSGGKIQSIGPSGSAKIPDSAQKIECTGESVMPGLVGMHDHLYMTHDADDQRGPDGHLLQPGFFVAEIPFTAPRLYLAAGVTTMRTTGSIEPYADLQIKKRISQDLMPGPEMDITAPYLEGAPTQFAQMHELTGPENARRLVDYWMAEGASSFKAYMNISRAELHAAIEDAHARHLKLTGHLCSITLPEAISLGIDDLEHGPVFTDTEFVSDKKPDACPAGGERSWLAVKIDSPEVQGLIHELVEQHVAVTSTLPVFEMSVPGRPPLEQRVLEAMSPDTARSYLTARARVSLKSPMTGLFRKEMDFEMAFVNAGGLLLAGPDPTGMGGVLPGFGDQREVELLVEAGFTPVKAIEIATSNGAKFLGRLDSIGTLAPGKQADMVLINGDPAAHIDDIEKVQTVFKDGVGYDSAKLIDSVRGQVGVH